jgi:hypothetical protein
VKFTQMANAKNTNLKHSNKLVPKDKDWLTEKEMSFKQMNHFNSTERLIYEG